jgi:hypothetical protein
LLGMSTEEYRGVLNLSTPLCRLVLHGNKHLLFY